MSCVIAFMLNILVSALGRVFGEEAIACAPRLAEKLIKFATQLLAPGERHRAKDWDKTCNETRGPVSKTAFALSCVFAALRKPQWSWGRVWRASAGAALAVIGTFCLIAYYAVAMLDIFSVTHIATPPTAVTLANLGGGLFGAVTSFLLAWHVGRTIDERV